MFWRFLLSLPVFIGQFFRCAFIGAVIGPMAFFLGQLLPRDSFDYESSPYKCFAWERNGLIYTKIGIQHWKDAVPDMSRYVTTVMNKKLNVFRSAEYLDSLIKETCVAELVHYMLMLLSPIFLILMEGAAGWIGALSYCICNLPFVLIQRYNRPRLITLYHRQCKLNEPAAQS